MEQLTALMILIGCSGPMACHGLDAPSAGYRTVDACRAELKPAIMAAAGKLPEIYGTCAVVGSDAFEQDASVTWTLSDGGRIAVSVVYGDEEAVGRPTIVARGVAAGAG